MGNQYWGSSPAVADGEHAQWGPATSTDAPTFAASIRFDLLDRAYNVAGSVAVNQDTRPTVGWDPAAKIPRVVSGVALHGDDANGIDFDRDMLMPVWVTPQGEIPLGVFRWATASLHRHLHGDILKGGVLYDLTLLLDRPLLETVAIAPVPYSASPTDPTPPIPREYHIQSLREAVELLGVKAGIPRERMRLPGYDLIPARPMGWPAGTPIRKALHGVLFQAGWVQWFDRHGLWHVGRLPTPELDPPTVSYRTGDNVWGVLSGTDDDVYELWRRPNWWRVLDVAPTQNPVYADWELPRQAAGSRWKTGEFRPRVIEAQGLRGKDEALAVLVEAVRDDWHSEEHITFRTRPNPAVDAFTVVEWFGGERFLQESWSMPLDPTGEMSHKMRRVRMLLDEDLIPDV